MVLVSATHIRLRRRHTLPFLLLTLLLQRRLARSPGFRAGRILAGGDGTYWTLTAWDDEASMRAFRRGRRHVKAMRRAPRWSGSFQSTRWEQESDGLPDWEETARRVGVDPPRNRRHGEVRPRSTG